MQIRIITTRPLSSLYYAVVTRALAKPQIHVYCVASDKAVVLEHDIEFKQNRFAKQ